MDNLSNRREDYLAAVGKGVFGAIPGLGSVIAEFAGTIIPNQRMDRLAKFAQELHKRLAQIEEMMTARIKDVRFADLFEDACIQATRSLSDERRAYLASLIAISLTSDDVEYNESKHLLQILGELIDIEVLVLRYYAVATISGDEEFRQKHRPVVRGPTVHLGSPEEERDKGAVHDSYRQHLARLNLLKEEYKIDRKTGMPEFESNGNPTVKTHRITRLGNMMLKHIGILPSK